MNLTLDEFGGLVRQALAKPTVTEQWLALCSLAGTNYDTIDGTPVWKCLLCHPAAEIWLERNAKYVAGIDQ